MEPKLIKYSTYAKDFSSPLILPSIKITPEKLHNIIEQVNLSFEKLSPTGCSLNVLASKKNIDSELDTIKQKISDSEIFTSKLLSGLNISPFKKQRTSPLKSSPLRNREKLYISSPFLLSQARMAEKRQSLSPTQMKESKRVKKIDEIIKTCNSFEKDSLIDLVKSDKDLKKSQNYCRKIVKRIEGESNKDQVFRIYKDIHSKGEHPSDQLKVVKVMKRSKKIWKQNFAGFMKNIDSMVYSVAGCIN